MQKFFLQKNKRAFTLVETLVAVSIFSVSILGLISVLASGVANTNYAKQKIVAGYLAQEGIEYIRNVRDTDVLTAGPQAGWNQFVVAYAPPATPTYPTASPYTSFTRTLQVTTVSANDLKISCTVSWKQGSGTYNITLSEDVFNWVEQ